MNEKYKLNRTAWRKIVGTTKGKKTRFKLNKSGCRHFMSTRKLDETSLESSCIYCGITVNYPKVNQASQERRTRVEAELEEQNSSNKQKKSRNSKGD